jgi:hypothetical protein
MTGSPYPEGPCKVCGAPLAEHTMDQLYRCSNQLSERDRHRLGDSLDYFRRRTYATHLLKREDA